MGHYDLDALSVLFHLIERRGGREIVPAPGAVVGPEIDQDPAFLNGRGLLDWVNW